MQSCPLHGEFPVKLDISGLCRAGWHAVAPVGAPIKRRFMQRRLLKNRRKAEATHTNRLDFLDPTQNLDKTLIVQK